MITPRILALDLSLTASGVATPDGDTLTLKTSTTGTERLFHLRSRVIDLIDEHDPTLVAIEGYAFGRTNQAHQMGELGGVIRLMLHVNGQPWCLIPPASLKKYATGKGNASKADVLVAAVRRLGYEGSDDNQADALWLRAMTLDHLGAPAVVMPAANRAGLDKVAWPTTELAA